VLARPCEPSEVMRTPCITWDEPPALASSDISRYRGTLKAFLCLVLRVRVRSGDDLATIEAALHLKKARKNKLW
jgi:hypothetical protein